MAALNTVTQPAWWQQLQLRLDQVVRNHSMLPMDLQVSRQQWQRDIRKSILQNLLRSATILIDAANMIIESHKPPIPYHTSVLSGEAWVKELLAGHPERIHTELGMHHAAFLELISTLQNLGHSDSRFITLKEQLSIFLYTCVTGLTLRHVGERFQRSNETISK